MTNKEVAEVFANIAAMLQIKGEVIYKIVAYQRAAESLENLGRDVNDVWREGPKRLREIPGVGEAIAEKIDELLRTGRLGFYEKLRAEIPAGVVAMLKVSDVGPKKAALFWKQLGITSLAELEAAARAGRLRDLPGMGARSEQKIIAGIEALSRRGGRVPLGRALPAAEEMLAALRNVPGVVAAETAGSLRRMRATIGDIDLLVASADPGPVMEAFTALPGVSRVLGKGTWKSSVEFSNGLRAQVWVHPPQQFGTALQYATGSKDHNVQVRELALSRGLSLSDHAFTRVKGGGEIFCASEEQVYRTIGLPWIPPELREGRGEIQAAQAGRLPALITRADWRGDLHSHSTWSDGGSTILEMALAARERGLQYLAITDHSQSLGVTGGLSPERLRAQRREIDRVNAKVGPGFRVLQGAEVEIRADGALDFPDDVLAALDIVVASLHTSLRQPRDRVTFRMLAAIRNPHVDIIGHPTGRLIPDREGADLDMEAVLAAAAEMGVALEVNANPSRLDLDDAYIRRALELGCTLTLNTDAHHPENLDLIGYGLATARRGWATAADVINTWDVDRLQAWLRERGQGAARRPGVRLAAVEPVAPSPRRRSSAGSGRRKPSAAKKAARKKAQRKK